MRGIDLNWENWSELSPSESNYFRMNLKEMNSFESCKTKWVKLMWTKSIQMNETKVCLRDAKWTKLTQTWLNWTEQRETKLNLCSSWRSRSTLGYNLLSPHLLEVHFVFRCYLICLFYAYRFTNIALRSRGATWQEPHIPATEGPSAQVATRRLVWIPEETQWGQEDRKWTQIEYFDWI